LCLIFTLFTASSHAIVNIEQAIIGPMADGFHNRLDFLTSGNTGNTENRRRKLVLLSLWQHNQHTQFLQVQYAYGTSLGQVDTDNVFAHLRHRTEINPLWGVEGFFRSTVVPLLA